MPLKLIQSPVTGQYYPVNIAGETPTAEERQRIQDYLLMKEREVPAVQEEIQKYQPTSGFGAFGVSTDRMGQSAMSFLEAVNKGLGREEASDYYGDEAERLKEKAEQKGAGLQSFGEIDSVGDVARFAGETVVGAVPYVAGSLVGAAGLVAAVPASVTAAAGTFLGVPVISALGASIVNYPIMMGQNRERQKEELARQGKPVIVDESAAALAAIPQTALESIGTIFITSVKKAGLKFNPEFFETGGLFTKIVDKTTGSAPKRIAGAVGTGSVAEAITEVGQVYLERMQAGLSLTDEDARREYLEAGIAGGLVGGVFKGGITGVSEYNQTKKKADKQTQLNNDLDEEYRQNVQTQKNSEQSFTDNPLLLTSEEGSVLTDGLNKAGETLATEGKEPRPVRPDELTVKQIATITNERTKKGLSLDQKQFPITLEEISATLGQREARRLAAKQGIPVNDKDISTATVSKFSYDQYKKVLKNIRKNKERDFSEDKINNIIQKTTGHKSFELTEAIRNELVGRNHLRATQDRSYRMETGMSIPVGEVEFQKAREFTKGRLAKESNELDDRIIESQEQLQSNQVEGRKERGKKQFTIPTLAKQLEDKIELANKLVTMKDNVTESVVPAINKLIKPYIANKTVKPFKTPLDVFKGINTILGSATSNNQRGVAYGLRKEIRDLQEEVAKTERGIEIDKKAHTSLQTNDFSVEKLKSGRRGSSQSNDPELLFRRQQQKEENLEKKTKELQQEQSLAKELKNIINKKPIVARTLEDQENYEAQVDKVKGIEEEVQKLNRDIKELEDIRRKPTASVTQNQGQSQSNQMNATASVGAKNPFVNEYQQNLSQIGNRLSKYLKDDLKLNPGRVKLLTENTIETDGIAFGKEQRLGHNKRVITLAMQLFDRDTIADPTKQDMIFNRIKGTLNHEVLHSLRALGLFTEQEFSSLVKAANTRKKVIWREGEALQRDYTYLDRIKRIYRRERFPNMDEKAFNDMVQEEAVADLFQDAMDGKLKLGGQPKTLLQRIIDFFKAIYKSNVDNAFDDISQIIEDVKSGKIGTRKPQELSSDDQVKFSLGEDVYDNAKKEKVNVKELDVYSRVESANANKPDAEFITESNKKKRFKDAPVGFSAESNINNPNNNYLRTVLVPMKEVKKLLPTGYEFYETIAKTHPGVKLIQDSIKDYDIKLSPITARVSVSEDGKSLLVMRHEGRNRLAALDQLGYKHVAVDLFLDDQYAKSLNKNMDIIEEPDRQQINKTDRIVIKTLDGDKNVFSINNNDYVKEQYVRNINALGFWSKLQEEIESMPQSKGTGDQLLGYLKKKSVKPQELYWTGIQSHLESNEVVTKDELVALIRANRIDIREVEMTATGDESKVVSVRDFPKLKEFKVMKDTNPDRFADEFVGFEDTGSFTVGAGLQARRGNLIARGIIQSFGTPHFTGSLKMDSLVRSSALKKTIAYEIIIIENMNNYPNPPYARDAGLEVLYDVGMEPQEEPVIDIKDGYTEGVNVIEGGLGRSSQRNKKAYLMRYNTLEDMNNQSFDIQDLERDAIAKLESTGQDRATDATLIDDMTAEARDHSIFDAQDFGNESEREAKSRELEIENEQIDKENYKIQEDNVTIQKEIDRLEENNRRFSPAEYETNTMKGGTNFRVIELELPAEVFPDIRVRPAHFKGKRQLVFVLAKERIYPDGKRSLYVDQLQSDWGQRGREDGFVSAVTDREVDSFSKDLKTFYNSYTRKLIEFLEEQANSGIYETNVSDVDARLKKRLEQALNRIERSRHRYTNHGGIRAGVDADKKYSSAVDIFQTASNELEDFKSKLQTTSSRVVNMYDFDEVSELEAPLNRLKKSKLLQKGVYPAAPFITNTKAWSELMVKRILKKASDEGFDYVTFPNGSIVEGLVGMRDEGKDYYDNQLKNYVKGILEPIDNSAYIGTYKDALAQLMSKAGKEMSPRTRELLSKFQSEENRKTAGPLDKLGFELASSELSNTGGYTQALVFNELILDQGGSYSGDINLPRAFSQRQGIAASKEALTRYNQLLKAQLVTSRRPPKTDSAFRNEPPFEQTTTKANQKYYSTYFNEDGSFKSNSDLGLQFGIEDRGLNVQTTTDGRDDIQSTISNLSSADHIVLSEGYTVRLTTAVKKALDEGQTSFSLGYIPGENKITEIKKTLMDRVISTLTENQYLVSSLPELEDDLKGNPTLNFRNLIPNTGRRDVVAVMRDYLTHRQNRAGDFRIDLDNVTEADIDNIATIMAAEAEVALAGDSNALGWYDAKFRAAKSLIALIRPEIRNNPEHDAVFDYALAVTSNGVAVMQNFEYALKQYDYWVENGKFDEIGYGKSTGAMEAHFALYNALTDMMKSGEYKRPKRLDNYPPEAIGIDIEHFLDRDIKIRDLINDPVLSGIAERSGVSLESLGSQEKKDTVVKMSTIIGSKIGGGFYQNLRGNYETLTMDMWWMRFFNRITGNPFKIPQDKTQLKNYNQFLEEITTNRANLTQIEKRQLKEAKDNIGNVPLRRDMSARTTQRMDQRIIDLAKEYSVIRNRYFNSVSKAGIIDGMTSEEKSAIRQRNREQNNILVKPKSVLLADSIKRNFVDFAQDTPRSATDRELMRKTTERAIRKLEQRGVVPKGALTNADFQAVMWFHEKELFDKLGARKGNGQQNDFVDSAVEALRKEGIDNDTIAKTLPIAERGRIIRGADSEGRVAEPSEGSIAARKQLAAFKSVKEKNDITRKQAEDIKKELDQKREPFYSLGYIPEERERDRVNFESTLRANVQDFQHKWNYSASSDFVAKILGGVKVGQVRLGYSDEKAKALSDVFIRLFQDRMIPASRMVDELQEKGFKLTDALNPIMQARLSQGKANEDIEQNRDTIHKDVVESVSRLKFTDAELEQLKAVSNAATEPDQGGEGYIEVVMKDFMPSFWKRTLFGTPSKQLVMAETYLYALHAKERNNYVREIDVNNINKFKDRGSGMSDREADAILNWFRNQERELGNLNDIRTNIQNVIDNTNEVRRTSGLQAMFLGGSNWRNYVPLRGAFDPEDETVDFNNAGQRKAPLFGSKGREDPVVKGRIDYAPNLIVNTLTQNANSIMRASQNNVGRVVLDMIREDPVMLQEFATIQDTVPERMFVDARTGVLSKRPATRDDVAKDKHILIVKENGNEVVIRFNSAVVAGAFRGDTGAGDASSKSYIRIANKFNRYLSSINTTFNPEFIVPNFVRDVQTAAVNIDQYEGESLKKLIIKRSPAMVRGIYAAVRNNDYSSIEAQAYQEFVKAGGKNVTNQMTTLGDQVADIQNTLNSISEGGARGALGVVKQNIVGKKIGSLISWIENTNTAMENAVRVSTFEALLGTGKYTTDQAALAAREITVNFARGGEYKTFLNSFYLFFNASLQGTFALAEAATRSKNVRRMWVGIVVAGILSDQINAMFSDEDDDGILVYDKTTDYTLEHNFLFPNFASKAMDIGRDEEDNVIQKNSLAIPMPYGLNLAYNVGRSISRRMRGAYTPAQATSSIMSTTMEALNPVGGTESFLNMVSPTVGDPVVSLLQNINYDRTPIYKQVSQFAVGTPDSQAYWNSASPMSISVAKFLNSALGGNEVKSGALDFSPDTLDFLFNYFTGGAGMFVQRTATFGYDLTTGKVFEAFEDGLTGEGVREQIRKTPIFRKAITSVSEREDTGKFIQKRNVVFGAKKELKNAIESRDVEEARRVKTKYPKELRIYGIIRAINTKRQKLTTLRNMLIRAEKTATNKELYKNRIKRIDKQIQTLVGRGNSLMNNIELDFFTEYGITGY